MATHQIEGQNSSTHSNDLTNSTKWTPEIMLSTVSRPPAENRQCEKQKNRDKNFAPRNGSSENERK